ncbi:MAG: hypothetical protein B0D91_14120 [Oceanospirillales bacterium LUC14_002_19_P2]|nr:MAG: hypothetical protein B0D91_14120 [Oceanospirillales bacterium LUC14_002_19_P2]
MMPESTIGTLPERGMAMKLNLPHMRKTFLMAQWMMGIQIPFTQTGIYRNGFTGAKTTHWLL